MKEVAKTNEGSFFTGKYRNLFKEIGLTDGEITRRINANWEELFSGNKSTRIYHQVDDDFGYMLDTGNLDVRTEGMSYGMMMAVQMNQKDIFDCLWNWTMKNMYMTEGEHAGYFAWSCQPDGTKNAYGPAPDGEEYFALALFFASHRWGDGAEPFNYKTQAKDILRTCIHKGEDGNGYSMWNRDNKLIKFIPDCEFTDPSYHLPHFYELFALWAYEEDREFWKEASAASRNYIKISCHPQTGLAPEYAYYDGTPNDENGFGHFYSDSYRVAVNIGLDFEWFRGDTSETEIANKLQNFFADKEPEDYRRYKVNGEPFDEKSLHPVGLLATNAMASLAADGPNRLKWVELLWNTPMRTGNRRYYDNCLYFFSILALSGHFKIWMPKD
ncbi:oligosaccharide reducing-end xylanase [Metabacillus crassostreae]|uniref:glycosyl hydrolase family 8 n=1 Tax=Metabacillus crassostreae TaxID=929098 RepID=UPI00195DBCE8|nr:glycosyl hydrolase family 8 [Metabacillus crassostreae]MBM7604374.1 oligosaccharide reducing-end xylanase [Metabacillus crassostreae]